MNFFLNNRQIIKDLKLNTGTSGTPTYTAMCTTSEIELTTDMEIKNFYVFCDAIERSLTTGASVSLDCTVKLDINKCKDDTIVVNKSSVHSVDMSLAREIMSNYNYDIINYNKDNKFFCDGTTLEYTTYTAPATLEFSDLGGAAEDEGEFSLTIHINGTSTAQ